MRYASPFLKNVFLVSRPRSSTDRRLLIMTMGSVSRVDDAELDFTDRFSKK